MPLSIVEDKLSSECFKDSDIFSKKHLKEVVFSMVQLVERSISEQLKKKNVAIFYDGWSK